MLSEADLSITKDAFSLAMKTKEEETERVLIIYKKDISYIWFE